MSPQAAIQIVLYSGIIPAAVALAAYFAIGWLLSVEVARRYGLTAAFAFAVFVGFAVSPTTKALVPAQFWEWIPYLGLLAAFVGGLGLADGVSRGERWIASLLVAAGAAFAIVPGWERLADVRMLHVAAVAAGIFLLTILLEPVADRVACRGFPFWLMLAVEATSIAIMSEWSETIGRSAATAAGALAGCGVATLMTKSSPSPRGLVLPYAVIVGCYAYVGFIYPQPPLTPIIAAPFAPLALWICTRGPLRRLSGLRAAVAQCVCVLIPLVVVAAILFARSAGEEW